MFFQQLDILSQKGAKVHFRVHFGFLNLNLWLWHDFPKFIANAKSFLKFNSFSFCENDIIDTDNTCKDAFDPLKFQGEQQSEAFF